MGRSLLLGTCFELRTATTGGSGGSFVAFRCDNSDGTDDGDLTFPNLPAGDYVLVEAATPPSYQSVEPIPVRIRTDRTAEVTIENLPLPGALLVRKVGTNGDVLSGSCFSVWSVKNDGSRDRRLARACDADDGADDGIISFTSLPPDNAILREDSAPNGYRKADDLLVSVRSGESVDVTVPNVPRGGGGASQAGQDARSESTPGQPTPTATPESTPTQAVPTATTEPTATPEPTTAPEATVTEVPTATATARPDDPVDTQL